MNKWTVMIYMAGDNNLSEDMIRGISELRKTITSTGDLASTQTNWQKKK